MMSNEIKAAGHIAHDGSLIWGAAATAEAAAAEARGMIGDYGEVDDIWPEPQATCNKTLDALTVTPCSAALLARALTEGGHIAWREVNGIACTWDESEEA